MDYRESIRRYFDKEMATIQALNIDELNDAINAVMEARDRGGMIYTMGNGGSAATASHMVCDFAKGASENLGGKKFKFECLCDNTPVVMAIANDIGYDDVFSFQLEKKLRAEDLVIAISGSGNSKNVIKAVEYAKTVGAPVIGITGYNGGKLRELADYRMHVHVDDMQIAEDLHMMFDHMMLRMMGEHS